MHGTFVYAALMWCSVNSLWATGYYLLMGALTATPMPDAFRGLDAPFSFSFYMLEVPKYAMIAYNDMNLVGLFAVIEQKTVRVALAGICVPMVFVNAYPLLLGKVVILPLFAYLRSFAVKRQFYHHRHARNGPRHPSWALIVAPTRDPATHGRPFA